MATIFIEGRPYTVNERTNLLQACLTLGFNIPYFCWHPALNSVGACRQCAVKVFKDENDKAGRIMMSCMTPVADGMRLSIDDPDAVQFRKTVIEWLMINHPHDCPVCDEGGECHLQDMTLMAGHNYRRYRFDKRTHRNQYLGPFVTHEMNRCIQCYRCVRFYRDYAGGRDLNVFGCHDNLYFGRESDGVLENEFAGNLVEICPTGVFTDKTLQGHYVRKWDLASAPSVCVHCSVGCNTSPSERNGTLRRIRNRFNYDVNGYFLCDRGRFAYEYADGASRLLGFFRKSDGAAEEISGSDIEAELRTLLESGPLIGVGSPRATLEANYLLRELVGPSNFCTGLSAAEQELVQTAVKVLREGSVPSASLRDMMQADAVLILGEDVTNTAPLMALSLRQSSLNNGERADRLRIPRWNDQAYRLVLGGTRAPFCIASAHATKLDDIATSVLRLPPEQIASLGFAIERELRGAAAERRNGPVSTLAPAVARDLTAARRPVIVSGVHSMSKSVMQAAANVAFALRERNDAVRLAFALPACNSFGLELLGGMSLEEASKRVSAGQSSGAIILENDIAERGPAGDALLGGPNTLVIDQIRTGAARRSRLAFGCASWAEGDGTLVNYEGRAQRLMRVRPPSHRAPESWRILRDILELKTGRTDVPEDYPGLLAAIASREPQLSKIADIVPANPAPIEGDKIARQPHRASGRTAIHASLTVHEPPPPEDRDSPLSFSMEGYQGYPPAPAVPFFWSPGWNSPQAVALYQKEVGAELRGGPSGRRLVEPVGQNLPCFDPSLPPPEAPDSGGFLLVPLFRVFGSEELSALAPAVAELIPGDFAALNPGDAERIGIGPTDWVRLDLDGEGSIELPANLSLGMAPGVAGLFLRAPANLRLRPVRRCNVSKAQPAERGRPS